MTLALVAGALAHKPGNGGNAWSRMSYVLGLRRLGFDVVLVEQMEEPTDEARQYFDRVCAAFGVEGSLVSTAAVPVELADRVGDAELLLNIGGHLTARSLKSKPRVRVYLDDDPGYTQLWLARGLIREQVAGHHAHFTLGASLADATCRLPRCGIDWRPTVPPVVLDAWPVVDGGLDRFTTIASWRGAYGPVEWEGGTLGAKAHEFRRVADLPRQADAAFEIALDIHPGDGRDRGLLESHGWRLVDPGEAAATPERYRAYIQGSGAEFSVAQGAYVGTACGWFSDRTVHYLASGKPALVQDTGFGRRLPADQGLVAFSTVEEAASGARRIAADYEAHAAAARELAERYFDSDRVLARLVEEAGVR